MPAAANAARTSVGSPGKVGAFQPCGSPRKNWTASEPIALAWASGSPSCRWAPIRVICREYRAHSAAEQTVGRTTRICRALDPESAVPEACAHASSNDACHDEDSLLPGGGEHLGHHARAERQDAENGCRQVGADHQAERECGNAGKERERSR